MHIFFLIMRLTNALEIAFQVSLTTDYYVTDKSKSATSVNYEHRNRLSYGKSPIINLQ